MFTIIDGLRRRDVPSGGGNGALAGVCLTDEWSSCFRGGMKAAKVSLSGSPERERAMVPGLPGRQHEAFFRAADFRIRPDACRR